MTSLKFIFCFLFLSFQLQILAQSSKCVENINAQVWGNFTKAFETFDYELFGSLHSENFVRASGNSKSLKNKSDYISGYAERWKNAKDLQTISFRFLERFCDDKKASERGIYKLTVNLNQPNEKSYYGKFHVILSKSNNQWKLIVDYDSDEGNTITEQSYLNAYAIDDFEKY